MVRVPWAQRGASEQNAAPVASFFGSDRTPDTNRCDDGTGVPPGFGLLGPTPHLRKAQEWLFVLQSVGLDGSVRQVQGGSWAILVQEHNHARALETLRTYEAENRDWPPAVKKDRPVYARTPYAPAIFGALALFFLVTGPAAAGGRFFSWGTADTDQMMHGAWWQAVTALTLHSDAGHVLGNAISGTVFLTAVHRRLGAGLGTLVVLAAGAAGNALNALWHHVDHRSIGASTAVFAAIGVLAATQLLINRGSTRSSRFSIWGPIVGGLTLLGTLGAVGGRTDLHAHGFGFLAGVVLGLIAAFPLRKREAPLHWGLQASFGALSALTVAGAWAAAIVRARYGGLGSS
jgi:rhomboid protease GluP